MGEAFKNAQQGRFHLLPEVIQDGLRQKIDPVKHNLKDIQVFKGFVPCSLDGHIPPRFSKQRFCLSGGPRLTLKTAGWLHSRRNICST
jgi:hypothetical protein